MTGPFQKVLAFLRLLERLEVFVVISEMNVRQQSQQMENGVGQAVVAMDLTLTAYGRQSKPADQLEVTEN